MARETIHGRAGVAVVRMALIACHGEMCAHERESRAIVIESRRLPRVVIVAQQAILRIIIGNVIGIRRALKISLMTQEAVFRYARETAVHMALRAIYSIVCAKQWKSRAVMIETLTAETGKLPAGNHAIVALLATQRKPCLLMIGICGGLVISHMTCTALQGQIDELRGSRLCVAIIAAHVLMAAQQRKT